MSTQFFFIRTIGLDLRFLTKILQHSATKNVGLFCKFLYNLYLNFIIPKVIKIENSCMIHILGDIHIFYYRISVLVIIGLIVTFFLQFEVYDQFLMLKMIKSNKNC
ncbi:hypothetical protein BpHYR1_051404 [Brachionus plicatilis]|uniref:Uncharacterized protein n=1 Tax=Brachionus plicatilis TaxID=10195 RepID=A0A3M7S249_BRAPC|nr:hypothetical protein BpHYR1_051404 [Brachionus plicatilis]